MLIRKSISFFLLFILCGNLCAQTTVTGTVVDAAHQPLGFVSVILTENKKVVGVVTTDEKGNYILAFHSTEKTIYSLQFSLVGYQSFSKDFVFPDTGFASHIILIKEKNMLAAVTVNAKKPLVTRKADRFIVNVENSFLANGNSGLEVLQKSPGIRVDNKDVIHIKGDQPVTVMINDVIQRMSEDDLAEYLRSLKSEDISRIEVIPNPPSEYEATGSGGIIHIILKKARKNGLNGSINAQYKQQGVKPYVSTGSSIDYKIKKLYLSAGTSFSKDIKSYYEKAIINYLDNSFYQNYTSRNEEVERTQCRAGIAYDFSSVQSAAVSFTAGSIRSDQLYHTGLVYQQTLNSSTGNANTDKSRRIGFSTTTFNYSWKIDTAGSVLKLLAEYSSSNKKEWNYYDAVYSDPLKNTIYRNTNPNDVDVYGVQVDLTKVYRHGMEFKTGIKYSSIQRDNALWKEDEVNGNWIVNNSSNHFLYTENLWMGYASLGTVIHHTNIKAGLRAEETQAKGNVVTANLSFNRKYAGLFPSLFITQNLDEQKGRAVYFSYSRSLQRPDLSRLNPYRLEYNNYTAMTGNPQLLPQYSNNAELGYRFGKDFSVDVYLTATRNVMSFIASPGNNNFIEYTWQNLNSSFEYGASLNAPVALSKHWSINTNLLFYDLSYTLSDQSVHTVSFSVKSIQQISLEKIGDLDVTANYDAPRTTDNYALPFNFSVDAGLSKKISNKTRLRLYGTDLFNTVRERELSDVGGTHIDFYRKRPTRTVSLSVVYIFSAGKKFDSRKAEPVSSEEKNRAGN